MTDVAPDSLDTAADPVDDPMARFDAVLTPFLDRLHIGVVSEHQLKAAMTAIRNALAAAVSPAPPTGESLDVASEQAAAAKVAQMNAGAGPGLNDPGYVPPAETAA